MSLAYFNQEFKQFIESHPSKPKYFMEFTEQMPNLATRDEKYPLVFLSFNISIPSMNVITYSFDVYALDLLRDDRSNVIDVISEMTSLLNDIYQYFNGNHDFIDLPIAPVFNPLNNFDLDYVAGRIGTFDFELPQNCDNLINYGN